MVNKNFIPLHANIEWKFVKYFSDRNSELPILSSQLLYQDVQLSRAALLPSN